MGNSKQSDARLVGKLIHPQYVTTSLLLALLLLLCTCREANAQDNYCLATDPHPYSSFGLRTAYAAADVNLDPLPVHLPGCRVVLLWLLNRHGTRNQSPADMVGLRKLPKLQEQIQENIAQNRSPQLCAEDLNRILGWSSSVGLFDANKLTPQGEADMSRLGHRIRSRYPELFQNGSKTKFEFIYDIIARVKESSQHLREGMGLSPASSKTGLGSLPLFFLTCPSYIASFASYLFIDKYKDFFKERAFTDMIDRVSSKLGFTESLNVEEVISMYDACGFEQAQNWDSKKGSPWCAVFGPKDFEVLEFFDDIKEYYRTGYGHNETHAKVGCVAVEEMVRALQSRVTSSTKVPPSATFYTSHDTLLSQTLVCLHLFYDNEKLRPDNFDTLAMKNRRWRISKFSPFGSNVGAVLFECDSGEKYRVQLLLNEKPLVLEGFDAKTKTCTWTQFLAKFGETLTKGKKRHACWGL